MGFIECKSVEGCETFEYDTTKDGKALRNKVEDFFMGVQ